MSLRLPDSRFFNSGGKWVTRKFNKKLKACQLWENMRQRVESEVFHKEQPTYKEVDICEEWLDYQNFAEWFDVQVNSGGYKEGWHLDKDLLSPPTHKVYSPETCVFLPKDVNNILMDTKRKRGNAPRGVTLTKGAYCARVNRGTLPELSKSFNCPIEAFNFYKEHKENYVKYLISLYESELDERVLAFFSKYEVKIDD
jgi:hypothetical protein